MTYDILLAALRIIRSEDESCECDGVAAAGAPFGNVPFISVQTLRTERPINPDLITGGCPCRR